MKTAYETALDEFRDAAAAVRLTFAAVSEAREIQIIADQKYDDAQATHVIAQSRYSTADAALQAARAEAPQPPDIDATVKPQPLFPMQAQAVDPVEVDRHPLFGIPFNQMFNGSADKADPAAIVALDDEPSEYPSRAE